MEPGSRCLVCGEGLGADLVWCTDCSTPTHKECFAYNGRCPIFGCQGMRYRVSDDPRDRGVKWIEVRDEGGQPVPMSYIVDFTSTREAATVIAIMIGVLGMFICAFPPKNHRGAWSFPYWATGFYWSLATAIIAGLLRAAINDYRIVDSKTRTIWLHRHFFGVRTTTVETTLSQVREVILAYHDSHQKSGWQRGWSVWLRLADGSGLKMTDDESQSILDSDQAPQPESTSAHATAAKLSRMVRVKTDVRRDYVPAVTR